MLSSWQDTMKSQVKPLGAYLIEAGLLSEAQVQVILADQLATDMKFGEIAAVRGWVKQQTIDYLMDKVVIPERRKLSEPPQSTQPQPNPPQPNPPQPTAAAAVAARMARASAEPTQNLPKPPAYSFTAKKPTPKTAPQRPPARPAQPQPVKPELFNADTEDFEWLG